MIKEAKNPSGAPAVSQWTDDRFVRCIVSVKRVACAFAPCLTKSAFPRVVVSAAFARTAVSSSCGSTAPQQDTNQDFCCTSRRWFAVEKCWHSEQFTDSDGASSLWRNWVKCRGCCLGCDWTSFEALHVQHQLLDFTAWCVRRTHYDKTDHEDKDSKHTLLRFAHAPKKLLVLSQLTKRFT